MFKGAGGSAKDNSKKALGDSAESSASAWLQARGLKLLESNYRVARGPRSPGGEIDLILRENDGTLVFVEVRSRKNSDFGGAAASIGAVKQQRIVFAARHYLLHFAAAPPCRFDVVTVERGQIEWLQAAFDAG